MSKPKILYIGYYNGRSGYSRAAAENIMALREYADVAARNFACSPGGSPVFPEIGELEKRTFSSYDVIVQHIPPWGYSASPGVAPSVGVFYAETWPLPCIWMRNAKLMDSLVFPNAEQIVNYKSNPFYDGQRIDRVLLPCDTSRYIRKQTPPKKITQLKADGRFLFYTVGEFVPRKNVHGLLRAFIAEFRQNEHVGLVIKCGAGEDSLRKVQLAITETERASKIALHAPVYVVNDYLSDDELDGLHYACDCFVQPSYSESISIPAMDALGFGKTPIVTGAGGFLEYLDDSVGWLIPCQKAMVSGEGPDHGELFTSRQFWWNPDLVELRSAMRTAFSDPTVRKDKASRGFERAHELFSREVVGPQLVEAFTHAQVRTHRRLEASP